MSTSPRNAPVQRTSVSRSEETPESRITFETEPLTPQSAAAAGRHRVAEPRPAPRSRLDVERRLAHERAA